MLNMQSCLHGSQGSDEDFISKILAIKLHTSPGGGKGGALFISIIIDVTANSSFYSLLGWGNERVVPFFCLLCPNNYFMIFQKRRISKLLPEGTYLGYPLGGAPPGVPGCTRSLEKIEKNPKNYIRNLHPRDWNIRVGNNNGYRLPNIVGKNDFCFDDQDSEFSEANF